MLRIRKIIWFPELCFVIVWLLVCFRSNKKVYTRSVIISILWPLKWEIQPVDEAILRLQSVWRRIYCRSLRESNGDFHIKIRLHQWSILARWIKIERAQWQTARTMDQVCRSSVEQIWTRCDYTLHKQAGNLIVLYENVLSHSVETLSEPRTLNFERTIIWLFPKVSSLDFVVTQNFHQNLDFVNVWAVHMKICSKRKIIQM